jgi:hypothetical protein
MTTRTRQRVFHNLSPPELSPHKFLAINSASPPARRLHPLVVSTFSSPPPTLSVRRCHQLVVSNRLLYRAFAPKYEKLLVSPKTHNAVGVCAYVYGLQFYIFFSRLFRPCLKPVALISTILILLCPQPYSTFHFENIQARSVRVALH